MYKAWQDPMIGIWYKVRPTFAEGVQEIKILPSERLTENQDSWLKYFEVLVKDYRGQITSSLNDTLEKCKDFIKRNYEIQVPENEKEEVLQLIQQLQDDRELMSRSENKNIVDASYRIKYACDSLIHFVNLIDFNHIVAEGKKKETMKKTITLKEFVENHSYEFWDNCKGKWIVLSGIEEGKNRRAMFQVYEEKPEWDKDHWKCDKPYDCISLDLKDTTILGKREIWEDPEKRIVHLNSTFGQTFSA